MQTAIEQEYKILITHAPESNEQDGQIGQRWWAMMLDFPFIVEEALSRNQALAQVERRIATMMSNAEVITLRAPEISLETNGSDDKLIAQGWHDHGLFKNDPGALELFDEIERERDRHLVGGE